MLEELIANIVRELTDKQEYDILDYVDKIRHENGELFSLEEAHKEVNKDCKEMEAEIKELEEELKTSETANRLLYDDLRTVEKRLEEVEEELSEALWGI